MANNRHFDLIIVGGSYSGMASIFNISFSKTVQNILSKLFMQTVNLNNIALFLKFWDVNSPNRDTLRSILFKGPLFREFMPVVTMQIVCAPWQML